MSVFFIFILRERRRASSKRIKVNSARDKKANISTKNTSFFKLGTEWNAEKTEKTPIFAKKSAHNEQL